MSNETLFFACGIVLALSAVTVSIVGLKLKDFPGKALPAIILWFAVFVGGATTFAVLHAKDEQSAKAAELEKAGEEIEKGQTSGPYENEGGALGGETEQNEEQAEKEAEGSVEGEEPVGPTEGSQEGEGAQTPEPHGAEGKSTKSGEGEQSKSATGKTSGGNAQASATTLKLAASPTELAFDKESLTAKA